jgi:hypothetical protein
VSSEDYTNLEAVENPRTLGMIKSRVLLLSTVSFLLIIGSLVSIAFDEEYWPFSPYPMFSGVAREPSSVSTLQLYGVPQEEPHDEILIPMDRDTNYIKPFDQSQFTTALRRIQSEHNPKKSSRLLNNALLDSLKRYEESRLVGLHDGPPLQGLRLYRVKGYPEAGAENVDRPDNRELIAEVEQG